MTPETDSPYLIDASGYRGSAERVFLPSSEAEVAAILREATALRKPVTIAGAGTGLTGGRVPHSGWLVCLAIIAVATAGKLGGSAVTARVAGMQWREALQLGAVMNTRGLMELIALNIGYDLGILSPRIFAMLVIMALVTTLMTGPLFTLFGKMKQL